MPLVISLLLNKKCQYLCESNLNKHIEIRNKRYIKDILIYNKTTESNVY